MKKILILSMIIAATLSTQVFAALVARLIQTPGFFTGPNPVSAGILIHDDGRVTSFLGRKGTRIQEVPVATLAPARMQALMKAIDEVKEGELALDNPEAPRCADAPPIRYEVFRGRNAIAVGSRMDCRMSHLNNGTGGDIVEILGVFQTIANLQ